MTTGWSHYEHVSVQQQIVFQFASLVSFNGTDSYLRFVDVTSENPQLTLKFKTAKPNGLLFVYVSRTQTAIMPDSISLSLVNGPYYLLLDFASFEFSKHFRPIIKDRFH